jgi:hypothetical protein
VLIGKATPAQDQAEGEEARNQDDAEMIQPTANAELIGGRVTVLCRNIFGTILQCVIEPIQHVHKQRIDNKEAKQNKAAITLPQLSDTSQRVAQVVASKQPAERPVLCGLIQETASKPTSNLEKHLQSLDDKLKAAILKKGDGTRPPKSILRKKGKPAAQNQLPKKKSAISSAPPAQGNNSNATARNNKKKKPKKRCVSFNGNKDA